jgi:hypothetical protein
MMTPPRELSPKEAEDRGKAMFALDQRIREALAAGRRSIWEAARALAEFDAENGWTALGYDTLAEWLADPEISMSRATYYRMVRVATSWIAARCPRSRCTPSTCRRWSWCFPASKPAR